MLFVFVCISVLFIHRYVELLDETRDEELFNPGIHAILSIDESLHPTTLRAQNSKEIQLFKIVLFYWPVYNVFDVNFGINRSNVSCLYLRTLHEISDCVVAPLSMQQV